MDEISKLRIEIDKIDQQLLSLIIQRVNLVKQIGINKKKQSIQIIDEGREEEILSKLTKQAGEMGMDPDIVRKIWKVLISISYEIEEVSDGNS